MPNGPKVVSRRLAVAARRLADAVGRRALAQLTHAEAAALVGQRLLTRAHLSDQ
jgi:hypothetical protein